MIHVVYSNACASHLKNGATSSSWGVKSKRLETVSPAHIPAQVEWRIQSTTKGSSLSSVMTPSILLQSQRWSQRWTSWRRHVSSTTKLEDITMLRNTLLTLLTTLASFLDCVDWWSSVFVWWCLTLWPCLIRFFIMMLVYCRFSTYSDISCLDGFFFYTSLLVILRLST